MNNIGKLTENGFTLLEILIVIVILAILSAVVFTNVDGLQDQTQYTARKADIQALTKALEVYKVQVGFYPERLKDLTWTFIVPESNPPRAAGPFLKNINRDPVDHEPYEYERLNAYQYMLEGDVVGIAPGE